MNEIAVRDISVIVPISNALAKTKILLFKPFDMSRWFAIGFCAWLTMLIGQGGGFNFYRPLNKGAGAQIGNYIQAHLILIISIVSAVAVVGVIMMLVCLWLSSRGRFMFLRCVAQNKAQVKLPWRQYRYQGNSLFVFRLLLGLTAFVCIVAVCAALSVPIFTMRHNPQKITIIIIAAAGIPILALLSIGFALVGKFTKDFVVPIMYLRDCSCVAGWKEFLPLLRANIGRFTLYILFQIVIGTAISSIVFAAACLTCCLAACLMAIPYIGTVILLPILVFRRSYSICYLRQYGSAFDVFTVSDNQP